MSNIILLGAKAIAGVLGGLLTGGVLKDMSLGKTAALFPFTEGRIDLQRSLTVGTKQMILDGSLDPSLAACS